MHFSRQKDSQYKFSVNLNILIYIYINYSMIPKLNYTRYIQLWNKLMDPKIESWLEI